MGSVKPNLSMYFFVAAGLLLLASLSLLPGGQLAPWIIAKVLYGAGAILFIFNR